MNIKNLGMGILLVSVGFLVGLSIQRTDAQESSASSNWEIYASPYGQQSFFVVKHNRETGDTLILNGAKTKAKEWQKLPVKDESQ